VSSPPEPPVRRVSFEYDDDLDPAWQPRFPEFAAAANAISLLMPHAEPAFIRAVRAALPQLDGERRADADAFIGQEAQHARQHRRFNTLVLDRYPALRRVDGWAARAYGSLDRRRLPDRLAFAAGSETIAFGIARWTEHHLHECFDGADPRPATLYLWHLAEEVEHKHVAYAVFDAVDGSRLRYALATLVSVVLLVALTTGATLVMAAGERRLHLPVTWFRLTRWAIGLAFTVLPLLAASATPGHDPRSFVDPVYLSTWLRQYDPATGTMPLWSEPAAPNAGAA
jgi:uncharacterized protein